MVKDQQVAEKMWQHVVELHPDKKGKEPWNALNLADEGQSVLFEELRKSFQQSATLEEQMLALYLMNELSTPEKVGFFFDVTQAKNGVHRIATCKVFLLLNSHKSIPADLQQFEQCARIADALYNYTKKMMN